MENSNSSSQMSSEEIRVYEDRQINDIVTSIIGDKREAAKFNRAMEGLRMKVGLLPLESVDYKPKNELESVIYNMRWKPSFYTNCDLMTLHEHEMMLCAHITYIKAKENRWMSAYKIENQSFKRAVSRASKFCKAKTVTERQAEAVDRNDILQARERTLEIYKLYADQCENISDTFIQMDNALKKLIDTRRFEMQGAKRQ